MAARPTISPDQLPRNFVRRERVQSATPPVALGSMLSDLSSLQCVLGQLVDSAPSEEAFLRSIVDLAQRLTNARQVSYFLADSDAPLIAGPHAFASTANPLSENPASNSEERDVSAWAELARRQQQLVLEDAGSGLLAIAVPVPIAEGQPDAICAIVDADRQAAAVVSVVLQLIASHVTLWHAKQTLNEMDCESANSAALVEVMCDVARCSSVSAAAQLLVEESRKYLGSERVAIGLVAPGAKLCRLVAVSGVTQIDAQATLSHQFEAVLNESLLRTVPGRWPPGENDRHLLSAHRQLSEACNGNQVYSARLCNAAGTPLGAWAFVGTKESPFDTTRAGFLRAGTSELGTLLELVKRSERTSLLGKLFDRPGIRRLSRSRKLAAALLVAAGCLALPIPHRISCDCVLEPVVRRYVAAPYDGTFEKSLVKPGDVVHRDQVLGRLEGREVRVEMAGLVADQSRTAKSRDVNMATGKTTAAQIDKLEMERLEQKKRLLMRRLEHLEIKSPIDGIVISGDLQRSEGVPVAVGQVLYEVAPLDHMVAEVAITDEERSHAQESQSVRVKLDAFPGASWSAPLTRINPRSELRDDDNVFIGEVALENIDGLLRPGMRGEAKISSGRRPLVWIILHKPWNSLLGWMGW
jgi:hypothetical protein